jgi:hypothetical protein
MNRVLHIHIQHALLALVTVALLSVPFAHRAGAAPVTPEISQYLSIGGNISDICGDTGLHISGGCESCRIVSSMLLPLAAYTLKGELSFAAMPRMISETSTAATHPLSISPPVRAPPVV